MKSDQNGHETGSNWLSIAQACQLFGVSDRTVKRRIEAGEMESKLENLPRGGVRRLVLVDEREGHARDKTARDVRDTFERETQTVRDKTDERAGRAGQTARDTRGTNGEVELLRATVERDREEIQFLRGVIEQLQRDGAETRAALRKSLENAPRQLTAATAQTAPYAPTATAKRDGEGLGGAAGNGPQTPPERAEPATYGELADWLESQL